jgi:hypothetical protein
MASDSCESSSDVLEVRMTSPFASRAASAWISNAGALRAPFVRIAPVITPDLHESRIAMRTSNCEEAMRALMPSTGMRVSPRRSEPSFACPE